VTTLFISDLHLSGERPDIIKLFLDFLQQEAAGSEALYILGDLFEAWIGDDYVEPALAPVIDAFAALTSTGVPLFVMAGNRDFLMGNEFEQQTGCRLLPDPSIIDLYGTPTLLMHGDTLCTDDVDYQQLRQRFRDPEWQQQFLATPVEQRLTFAQQARNESREATRLKSEVIMDVNADAVASAFTEHGVSHLIHGHTHRPNTHHLTVDSRQCTRIVLGDWYQQGSVLRCDRQDCTLSAIPSL
jgi:UDP-2,3-diacylglucosamine hydrolase